MGIRLANRKDGTVNGLQIPAANHCFDWVQLGFTGSFLLSEAKVYAHAAQTLSQFPPVVHRRPLNRATASAFPP